MAVTTQPEQSAPEQTIADRYAYYAAALEGCRLPCAFLDLEYFERNIHDVAKRAHSAKTIRVASKSVRCVWALRHILERDPVYQGILAYNAHEAVYLAREGFDDILIGYPAYRGGDIEAVCGQVREGKTIVLMVDLPEHVEQIERIAKRQDVTVSVCIDVDMSTPFPGLHFGVLRSAVTDADSVDPVLDAIERSEHVRLDGIMGYEAQVAGLPERSPANGWKNLIIPFLKRKSIEDFRARRQAVVDRIRERGHSLRVVNGGGTGSVESTCDETCVTEATVGSGFFSPTQFDYYAGFKHLPAVAFAIEIVRRPRENVYTCAGGGYVASGPAGPDKLPQPYLPEGARLIGQEGAGEVQTPIVYDGPVALNLGDPVFMRHTKAGEVCERFNTLALIEHGRIVEEVPTYRGSGQCFL